ncbi:MAG: hypothetical protein MZV64_18920 [Ignavibacteriales bacterium]|nr:hypothetical protein [Ignavibacteriales bacterium]
MDVTNYRHPRRRRSRAVLCPRRVERTGHPPGEIAQGFPTDHASAGRDPHSDLPRWA